MREWIGKSHANAAKNTQRKFFTAAWATGNFPPMSHTKKQNFLFFHCIQPPNIITKLEWFLHDCPRRTAVWTCEEAFIKVSVKKKTEEYSKRESVIDDLGTKLISRQDVSLQTYLFLFFKDYWIVSEWNVTKLNEAIKFVVADLAEMLPSMTFVLNRCFCCRFKSGCATLLSKMLSASHPEHPFLSLPLSLSLSLYLSISISLSLSLSLSLSIYLSLSISLSLSLSLSISLSLSLSLSLLLLLLLLLLPLPLSFSSYFLFFSVKNRLLRRKTLLKNASKKYSRQSSKEPEKTDFDCLESLQLKD